MNIIDKIKKKKKMKNYKVFFPLTYSHHTKEKLIQEYTDEIGKYDNEKMNDVLKYLLNKDEFNLLIYILYANYNSLNLVAEETNTNKSLVYRFIKKMNEDIKKILE